MQGLIINDLKETQYTAQEELPADLSQVFALIRAISEMQPQSVVQVNPCVSEHLIVASDASQDFPRQGKAGILLARRMGSQLGTAILIGEKESFQSGITIPQKLPGWN